LQFYQFELCAVRFLDVRVTCFSGRGKFNFMNLEVIKSILIFLSQQSSVFWISVEPYISAEASFESLLYCRMKAVQLQAWAGPWGCKRFRLPEFQDNRHIKVVWLSTLRTCRLYHQEISMVLISSRGYVDLKAIVQPEGLSHWKILILSYSDVINCILFLVTHLTPFRCFVIATKNYRSRYFLFFI
jgi:hypothetical protein